MPDRPAGTERLGPASGAGRLGPASGAGGLGPASGAGGLGHRPELDGLRGIAVALVVLAHAGLAGFSLGGAVGVEVFFVLSGFLITTLLLEGDRLDLGRFYVRRARRLLPALVAFLAVVGLVAAITGDGPTGVGVVAGATYTSNLLRVGGTDLGWLNHLWSLSVEEHFYLGWPLVVLVCRRRDEHVAVAAMLGLVACFGWRVHLWGGGAAWDRLYNGTDTRISGILAGAVLAVVVRRGMRLPSTAAGLGALVLLLAGPVVAEKPFGLGFIAIDAAAAAVILGVVTRPSPVLASRPLTWLGQVSYALYLWHVPIFAWMGELHDMTVVESAGAIAASLLVAWLSTRFLEARWRRPTPAAAPAVAVSAPPPAPAA